MGLLPVCSQGSRVTSCIKAQLWFHVDHADVNLFWFRVTALAAVIGRLQFLGGPCGERKEGPRRGTIIKPLHSCH